MHSLSWVQLNGLYLHPSAQITATDLLHPPKCSLSKWGLPDSKHCVGMEFSKASPHSTDAYAMKVKDQEQMLDQLPC
jgi:hypothetical protein